MPKYAACVKLCGKCCEKFRQRCFSQIRELLFFFFPEIFLKRWNIFHFPPHIFEYKMQSHNMSSEYFGFRSRAFLRSQTQMDLRPCMAAYLFLPWNSYRPIGRSEPSRNNLKALLWCLDSMVSWDALNCFWW